METRGETERFEVAIVGGGASGTALLYALAAYTDIPRIALVEKYPKLGSVNSHATNNSQTLHVGDIETNYSLEKAREVKPAAMMVKRYTDALPEAERAAIIRQVQKMALAVGAREVAELDARFVALKELFPDLELLDGAGIARVEPAVMCGRAPEEPVRALYNPAGYAVNYGLLAQSFAKEAKKRGDERVAVFTGRAVSGIERREGGYLLHSGRGAFFARILVVDADAYSLGFAKSLGLGKEFSLIPIAGSFYFSGATLRGKVYTVQDPRMPFAAVHGDPDLTKDGATRWGPTARFYPVLEARRFSSARAFFASAGLGRFATWISFAAILLEPVRLWYLIKNLVYDLPVIGRYALLPAVRKIAPAMRARDLARAAGYGGMRLQRVNTRTRELLLGEGKIVGENAIFNMTPSPGASVSLYNAMRDAGQIVAFAPEYRFDKARMLEDLCERGDPSPSGGDVSVPRGYAS